MEVAKLRLSDFLKDHRRFTTSSPAIKGKVIVELYRKEIDNEHRNTERTKLYKREILIALQKSWPDFFETDIARLTQKDCREWAARYGRDYSPSRFNGALQIVRRLFALAIEEGHRNDNPALCIKRFAVKLKELKLPTQEQFHEMATHIETSGAAQAKDCAIHLQQRRHVLRGQHFHRSSFVACTCRSADADCG